jgi:hypothetical protein
MHHLRSTRLAWSIAFASLALSMWSAPLTWSATSMGTARLLAQTDDSSATSSLGTHIGDTPQSTDDPALNSVCPPIATAIARLNPPTITPVPLGPAAAEGNFHICGGDPATERAVEQLVGGRGFSATLVAPGDGCADLMVRVNPDVPGGSSSSTIKLSVSLGSGRVLDVQIASQQGATHASIVGR